jgi:hypothetical protein
LFKGQVCQLLTWHINDKSLVTQEETEYALYWRQNPILPFPLEEKKKEERKKENLLGFTLFPFPLAAPPAQVPTPCSAPLASASPPPPFQLEKFNLGPHIASSNMWMIQFCQGITKGR